jgi:hypothetical protein
MLIKLSNRERAAVLAALERNEVRVIESSLFNGSSAATFEWKGTIYEIQECFEKIISLKKHE